MSRDTERIFDTRTGAEIDPVKRMQRLERENAALREQLAASNLEREHEHGFAERALSDLKTAEQQLAAFRDATKCGDANTYLTLVRPKLQQLAAKKREHEELSIAYQGALHDNKLANSSTLRWKQRAAQIEPETIERCIDAYKHWAHDEITASRVVSFEECLRAIAGATDAAKVESYTPEELLHVALHTLIPIDFNKNMALSDLIWYLEQPDGTPTRSKAMEARRDLTDAQESAQPDEPTGADNV